MKSNSIFLIFAFILLSNFVNAQPDSVIISPYPNPVNTEGATVRVDFPVTSFDDILCLQYTMNYDPEIFEYQGFDYVNLPGLGEGNFGNPQPGKITFSWFDLDLTGVTLADGESIYSLFFFSIDGSGAESELFIDSSLTPIEVCTSTGIIPLVFNNLSLFGFVVSTEDVESNVKVNVYPNPSTDFVSFDISNLEGAKEINVYNINGQLISNHRIIENSLTLNKSNEMGAGTYYYRVIADDRTTAIGNFTLVD